MSVGVSSTRAHTRHEDTNEQGKGTVSPMVSASDRDPLASGLGLSTFISRARSSRVSFPGLRRAYLRARTLEVARRRRAERP